MTNIVSIENSFLYSKKVLDTAEAILEKYIVGGVPIDDVIAEADEAVKEVIKSSN
ncbi:MAG: hypothetical protein GX783_07805 [Clostridiales bacterium]|nr:hypothetical protein [Clostridiales bacterium]